MARARLQQLELTIAMRWTRARERDLPSLLDEARARVARELGVSTHAVIWMRVSVERRVIHRRRLATLRVKVTLDSGKA